VVELQALKSGDPRPYRYALVPDERQARLLALSWLRRTPSNSVDVCSYYTGRLLFSLRLGTSQEHKSSPGVRPIGQTAAGVKVPGSRS